MGSNVDAKTGLYGIIGNPVDHSLSPLLHNAAFEKLKINAHYLAFRVEEPFVVQALESVRALGIKGLNVTIPHKEAAFNAVDEVPEDIDRAIGAINTVVNNDGQLFGYNTDGSGFLTALKEDLSFNPEGKNCLVLGAGGSARAVVFALGHAHADKIWIHNRTKSRSEGLKEYAATYFSGTEIESVISETDLAGETIDLVVNTTSCGMTNDLMPIDLGVLKTRAAVYDLVYSPLETPFLKDAKRLGLPSANGLGMLAAQAALSFELWTGKKEGVRQTMLEALKKWCS
mgnify:FL=1